MKKSLKYRILMAIPFVLLSILYWLFTLDARNRWLMSEKRGMYCHRADNGMFGTTYHFDPRRAPKREYLTFKELWKKFGY